MSKLTANDARAIVNDKKEKLIAERLPVLLNEIKKAAEFGASYIVVDGKAYFCVRHDLKKLNYEVIVLAAGDLMIRWD
jgi:predicted RNA-binding protein with PUA domain